MLRFDPPELQQQLGDALHRLLDDCAPILDYEWYPIHEEDFDPNHPDYAAEDVTITFDTDVENCRLRTANECDVAISVAMLIRWADWLTRYKLKDRSHLRMGGETLVYVEGIGTYEATFARQIAQGKLEVAESVKIDGREFRVSLVAGFTPFAIFIEAEGLNDSDFFPSYEDWAAFVAVTHPEDARDSDVLSVVRTLLFELASSAGVSFGIASYPTTEDIDELPDAPDHNIPLRPITVGRGLTDLHELFVAGCRASPAEYALIHFVKIIEYVSATVIRMARHDALRRRLANRAALAPDAAFLDDLATLVEGQRIYSKDSEAIKLTVQTCCDPIVLRTSAPRCLAALRRLGEGDDAKAKRAALDAFSVSLSATRNQLSHAKANYIPTGDECPVDELVEFTTTARIAAEQVIRWFSGLPDANRVV